MDPLSAYRLAMPGMGVSTRAMPADPDASISKIIPKNELDKLSSSVLQPNAEMPPSLSPVGAGSPTAGTSFDGMLGNMVREVSAKQNDADASMRGALTGTLPLHQAMISQEEASVSFQLMVEVRNRLLESYQELMRMQV